MYTLYFYFWLNKPFVQTQVLSYLRQFQENGIKVSLMKFEREMSKKWVALNLRDLWHYRDL